jgi:hypothetical protein
MADTRHLEQLRALELAGALTPTALILDGEAMTWERFESLGVLIGRLDDACKWWLGDWLVFGEGMYGEKAAQAAEHTGRSPETLRGYRWVAERVPPSRRRAHLSFTIHRMVAHMEPAEQERWLSYAEDRRLSSRELSGHLVARATPLEAAEQQQDGGLTEHLAPPAAGPHASLEALGGAVSTVAVVQLRPEHVDAIRTVVESVHFEAMVRAGLARGEPDRRYDGALDALLDLADALEDDEQAQA